MAHSLGIDGVGLSTSQALIRSILVSGLNAPAEVSVLNGEWRSGTGAFSSENGFVNNGEIVEFLMYSSAQYSQTVVGRLTVGDAFSDLSATTADGPVDVRPNAFLLDPSVVDATLGEEVEREVVVAGISSPSPIYIVNSTYSINGGAFTSLSGLVNNGDVITWRIMASSQYSITTVGRLTIGGVFDEISVTTVASIDIQPDEFSFGLDVDNAAFSTTVARSVTITGINDVSPISVVNGEYSVNGGDYTSVSTTVVNGDVVTLRVTASAEYSTDIVSRLTVGGVFAELRVSTVLDPIDPVVSLSGGNPLSVVVNSPFVEPGFTAFDNVDGNLIGSVSVSGAVDTSTIGTYTLTYSVIDSSGNRGEAQRVVNVLSAAVVGSFRESIECEAHVFPAANDGYPHRLYSDNTNYLVVSEIRGERTGSAIAIDSVAASIVDSNESGVVRLTPTPLVFNEGSYAVSIPYNLRVSESTAVLLLDVIAVDGSRGHWAIPVDVSVRYLG